MILNPNPNNRDSLAGSPVPPLPKRSSGIASSEGKVPPADTFTPSCTAEEWSARIRTMIAAYDDFKRRLKRWHVARDDASLREPADPAVAAEADAFHTDARRHNDVLQQCKDQGAALGFTLDSTTKKLLETALLELKVTLKFPPRALQEAQQRIIAGKWKTLADVKHELGHQGH